MINNVSHCPNNLYNTILKFVCVNMNIIYKYFFGNRLAQLSPRKGNEENLMEVEAILIRDLPF